MKRTSPLTQREHQIRNRFIGVAAVIQELAAKESSEQVNEEVEKDGKKETEVKTVYKLEGEDEKIKQLIDIALLASGQLKGEALAKFVNRSVDLLNG